MNIHEGDIAFRLAKRGDEAYWQYIGRRGDRVDFGISVGNHPDSFAVSLLITCLSPYSQAQVKILSIASL